MDRNRILFAALIVFSNLLLISLVGDINLYILLGTELIKWTDFKINIFYLDYQGFVILSLLLLNLCFVLLYLKIKRPK